VIERLIEKTVGRIIDRLRPKCPTCRKHLIHTGERVPWTEYRPMLCPRCGEVYR
jgi:tRNA(Ile2) C34 agmatinyltransferase TiaS